MYKHTADARPLRSATVRLAPDLWERTRILAIRRRTSLQAVCSEALERYIADAEEPVRRSGPIESCHASDGAA